MGRSEIRGLQWDIAVTTAATVSAAAGLFAPTILFPSRIALPLKREGLRLLLVSPSRLVMIMLVSPSRVLPAHSSSDITKCCKSRKHSSFAPMYSNQQSCSRTCRASLTWSRRCVVAQLVGSMHGLANANVDLGDGHSFQAGAWSRRCEVETVYECPRRRV